MKVKTRIKIVEKNAGEIVYIPQSTYYEFNNLTYHVLIILTIMTGGIFWLVHLESLLFPNNLYRLKDGTIDCFGKNLEELIFSRIEDAQSVIDEYLKRVEDFEKSKAEAKKKKHDNKTKKVTYQKYP